MNRYQQVISPQYRQQALNWIIEHSENPESVLEPEFDIEDDTRRYAKKIRNLTQCDPLFWNVWFSESGLNDIVKHFLPQSRLLRHAAFIKRHADESYIPLHQDIALWEKKWESAHTFWIALTPSKNENGGLFYCKKSDVIYPHEFDLRYPMFKCIDLNKNTITASDLSDAPLDEGDVLVWPARTPHGSYANSSGKLRIGMPVVFVDEAEYQTLK